MNHDLKSWPASFRAIAAGDKTHELRRADREFHVDDTVHLQEYDPDANAYSGRDMIALITYITSAENPCALSNQSLRAGYCILSIFVVAGPTEPAVAVDALASKGK